MTTTSRREGASSAASSVASGVVAAATMANSMTIRSGTSWKAKAGSRKERRMKLPLHRHPRLHPPQDQVRVVKARQKVVEPQ